MILRIRAVFARRIKRKNVKSIAEEPVSSIRIVSTHATATVPQVVHVEEEVDAVDAHLQEQLEREEPIEAILRVRDVLWRRASGPFSKKMVARYQPQTTRMPKKLG